MKKNIKNGRVIERLPKEELFVRGDNGEWSVKSEEKLR